MRSDGSVVVHQLNCEIEIGIASVTERTLGLITQGVTEHKERKNIKNRNTTARRYMIGESRY